MVSAARACVGLRPPSASLLVATVLLLFAFVFPALGLRCIRCGEYTDGVGSITPCLNYTESQHLKDCDQDARYCVKYVTEASIVRECVNECEEREAWGTKIYCCNEDGCNGGELSHSCTSLLLFAGLFVALRRLLW